MRYWWAHNNAPIAILNGVGFKLPSPVVAIVGAGFLIVGVLEMVLYVWRFFCLSFDLAVAVAAAGYYILKRKYSVPDF